MNIISKSIRTATALLAVPLLLVNVSALGQEQVLAEVGVIGENSNGDGVVRPDFNDSETGDYTDWVAPAVDSRDYRGFAISPKGTALVLDGNIIREFNVVGQEKGTLAVPVNGFPVDCTAIIFNMPKKNGRPNFVSLSECGAFTPLNDETLRIAGQAQGGGFVIIKYKRDGTTTLAADGTPPSITDMDGDEFADAADRKGKGYWAVGDKKKVIWFPLDPPDTEQDFEVVATLNGKRIDSVTPFGLVEPEGNGRVVVVLNTGEMMSIDTSTGVATAGPVLTSAADCELGRKDPQRYSVRGDPTGVLFAGNRGGNSMGNCNAITLFDENLTVIIAATNPSLDTNPFVLDDSSTKADVFFVEGLDWQSGQGGDFTVDCGDPLVLNDPEFGCQYGAVPGQATMFEVEVAQNSDPTYRMFQFVDLVDCRHSGDRPCPIINCPAAAAAAPGMGSSDGNFECENDVFVPADLATGVAITSSNTITRNDGGNFITDGFVVGGKIELENSEDEDNDDSWDILTVASGVITVDGTPLTNNDADTTMTMAVDNSNTFVTGIPDEQVLDLTKLLLDADQTGVFRAIAFGDEEPPVMAIPSYMRGEEFYPRSGGGNPVDNGFKFVSFFAVTDAIFVRTFFVDYKIDLFRPDNSDDPCDILGPHTEISDLNEMASLSVYNSGDGFGTINRGGAEGTRGGLIGNSFCNGGATRARWSANTVGLELFDETPTAYVTQVERMMGELFQTRNELICAAFPNPDDPPTPPDSATLGPLLTDCSLIDNELNQMNRKLEVCIDSLFASQQGNSAENCNAFFTKVDNLVNVLDAAAWPPPGNPSNFSVLRPNYEGEFRARIDTLAFFVETYLLNGVPEGGILP